MKVHIPMTWRQASASTFNADKVRREGKRYRQGKYTCFVGAEHHMECEGVRRWIEDNKLRVERQSMVFDILRGSVYYSGISINFKTSDDVLLFKLRFS